jgi:predicted transcriptional regulator
MAKTRVREIRIRESKGSFDFFQKQGISKKEYDFGGLTALRQLLSNEKARILDVIKNQKPNSIYELAQNLNRPFKAVFDDLKLLERFGFIDFVKEKRKNRICHRPEIAVEKIVIEVKI